MKQEMGHVYEEYRERVYRFIFLMVHHKETAEDLTQETFYRAWMHYGNFVDNAPVAAWLIKIARNVTYDFYRHKKLIQWTSWSSENEWEYNSLVRSAELEAEHHEERKKLYAAITRLKPDYQSVLLLRKVNEKSTKETAFILGWTEAKVKMKLARALQHLKKELEQGQSERPPKKS